MPLLSTNPPDMTSISTSGQKLLQKKMSKIPPPTASDGISQERFRLGSPNFTHLSATVGLTNLLERTSLAVSGRHLSRLEKTAANAYV